MTKYWATVEENIHHKDLMCVCVCVQPSYPQLLN